MFSDSSTNSIVTLKIKRYFNGSFQKYSSYITLALFLMLLLETFNYLNVTSNYSTLLARNEKLQKNFEKIEVNCQAPGQGWSKSTPFQPHLVN